MQHPQSVLTSTWFINIYIYIGACVVVVVYIVLSQINDEFAVLECASVPFTFFKLLLKCANTLKVEVPCVVCLSCLLVFEDKSVCVILLDFLNVRDGLPDVFLCAELMLRHAHYVLHPLIF